MTDSNPSSSTDPDTSRIYPAHGDLREHQRAVDRCSLLRTKLADIRSLVSSWFQVVPEKVDFSDEDLRRQHDEVSGAISKTLLVLVAFASFCEVLLGTPDVSLVGNDVRIQLPLAGTAIYFATVLVVGPFLLIVCYICGS